MSKPTTLSREALYELIWSTPISKIGPSLGVSGTAISKICRKLDVPRPPRGYWARLAHGYSVDKPVLPEACSETPESHVLTPPVSRPRRPVPVDAESPMIRVKARIDQYHDIVADVRSILVDGWEDHYGRIGSKCSVNVSRSSIPRACRILDALILELELRGHSVSLEDTGIACEIEGEPIRIELHEPSRRQEHRESDRIEWKHHPTGQLALTLCSRYLMNYSTRWSDGKTEQLEELLGEVVATLDHAPIIIAEAKEEEYRQHLAWEREWLVRQRELDRYRFTRDRASAIDDLVDNHEKAGKIRDLVSKIESASAVPAAARRLARWANSYADHLDPLIAFRLERMDAEPPSSL